MEEKHRNNKLMDNNDDEEDSDDDFGEYIPTDQGWAWVIVAGCFGVCALIPGAVKSFGVLLVELSRKFDAPASHLTLSHSLAGFFHLSLAPLANALSNRFSHRIVVITGAMFASIGLIATSFATTIGWVYVTYGIITGIGFGLSFSPAITLQGFYFRERRALANGISASGAGAGCFALPNVIRLLMDIYGLSGCMMLLGGIILNACVFACLFRPFDFWKPLKRIKTKAKTYKNVPPVQLSKFDTVKKKNINGHLDSQHPLSTSSLPCLSKGNKHTLCDNQIMKADSLMLKSASPVIQKRDPGKDFIYLSIESLPSLSSFRVKSSQSYKNGGDDVKTKNSRTLIHWNVLKKPMFLILSCSICLNNMSQHLLFNVLPSIAEELGHSDEEGAFIVSIMGISDLVGRIGSGWFSDLKFVERKTVLHISQGVFAILFFISPHISSYIGLCALSVAIGITSGSFIGIQMAVLADKLGVHCLSSAVGFVLCITSIALLVNPFLSGVVRDKTGSWIGTLYIGGSVCTFAFLVLFLEHLIRNNDSHNNVPKEQSILVSEENQTSKEPESYSQNKTAIC